MASAQARVTESAVVRRSRVEWSMLRLSHHCVVCTRCTDARMLQGGALSGAQSPIYRLKPLRRGGLLSPETAENGGSVCDLGCPMASNRFIRVSKVTAGRLSPLGPPRTRTETPNSIYVTFLLIRHSRVPFVCESQIGRCEFRIATCKF